MPDATSRAEADRETIIRNLLTGQYSNALRVVAFNAAEGWSRDVSEEIADELLQRACDADEESRRGHQAVHRPARDAGRQAAACAVSVRRDTGADQAVRVGRKTGA
jgi:Mg/Co/Ni transporter MgtE